MLDAEQDAAHIDRQQLIDGRNVDLGDADHGRGNAGVGDQTVDAAEVIDGAIDHRLDVGLACDVGANEADPKALFQRSAFLLPARGDYDFGAFFNKTFDDAFADATRPAGDDRDFPRQRSHKSLRASGTHRPVLTRVHKRLISLCVFWSCAAMV